MLPKVLDDLKVPLIVGIGEGAGANVLVRFALTNQQRTLGKCRSFIACHIHKMSLILDLHGVQSCLLLFY